jgi:hypothetical protein
MEYVKFRELAGNVMSLANLIEMASDPSVLYELIQSPVFRRYQLAAYNADALSEEVRARIGAVSGRINDSISQLKEISFDELVDFCQILLRPSAAVSATNYLNQGLSNQVDSLRSQVNDLVKQNQDKDKEVAVLGGSLKTAKRDANSAKKQNQLQMVSYEARIEQLSQENRSRRMLLYPNLWTIIHGHLNTPPTSGGYRMIGIQPSSLPKDTEFPESLEGVAYFLERTGGVYLMKFFREVSVEEIREKARKRWLEMTNAKTERDVPDGMVTIQYRSFLTSSLQKEFQKRVTSLDSPGFLVGFIANERSLDRFLTEPLDSRIGLKSLASSLSVPEDIFTSDLSRYGIALLSHKLPRRVRVLESARSGCLPKFFTPRWMIQNEEAAIKAALTVSEDLGQ